MELQQQHQQQLLLSVDGYFDAGGNTKALLTKLLSLVLNMFTILLLLFSTFTRIVMPFTSTRWVVTFFHLVTFLFLAKLCKVLGSLLKRRKITIFIRNCIIDHFPPIWLYYNIKTLNISMIVPWTTKCFLLVLLKSNGLVMSALLK